MAANEGPHENGWNRYHRAARDGFISEAEMATMLAEDANVAEALCQQAPSLETPLHIATREGNISLCGLFCQYGGDVAIQDYSKDTCVSVACQRGQLDILKLYVDLAPPDVFSAKNSDGNTPLYCACEANYFECVEVLVNSPRRIIEAVSWSELPEVWECPLCTLHNSISSTRCEMECDTTRMVGMLDEWACPKCTFLNNGEVDVCEVCQQGQKQNVDKLLNIAAQNNCLEIFHLLINTFYFTSETMIKCLRTACSFGHIDICRAILDQTRYELDIWEDFVSDAARNGNLNVLEFLFGKTKICSSILHLSNLNNPPMGHICKFRSLLDHAAEFNRPRCCQFLLRIGFYPDVKSRGFMPIILALQEHSYDSLLVLLKYPVSSINQIEHIEQNRNEEEEKYFTEEEEPNMFEIHRLFEHCERGEKEPFMHKTLPMDIDFQRESDGYSLLHIAAERNHAGLCNRLLALGADPNLQNEMDRGYFPLHYAIGNDDFKEEDKLSNRIQIVKFLISFGANPCAENFDGQIPGNLTQNEELLNSLERPSRPLSDGKEFNRRHIVPFQEADCNRGLGWLPFARQKSCVEYDVPHSEFLQYEARNLMGVLDDARNNEDITFLDCTPNELKERARIVLYLEYIGRGNQFKTCRNHAKKLRRFITTNEIQWKKAVKQFGCGYSTLAEGESGGFGTAYDSRRRIVQDLWNEKGLRRFAKELAKNILCSHYKWTRLLITTYTADDDFCKTMNIDLASHSKTSRLLTFASQLDYAMIYLQSDYGFRGIVYRSVWLADAEDVKCFRNRAEGPEEGKHIVLGAFISTSVSIDAAKSFGGNVLFEIDCTKSIRPPLNIKPLSVYPGEEEVLLPPGMVYRVDAFEEKPSDSGDDDARQFRIKLTMFTISAEFEDNLLCPCGEMLKICPPRQDTCCKSCRYNGDGREVYSCSLYHERVCVPCAFSLALEKLNKRHSFF